MTKSEKLINQYKESNQRVLISPYELLGLHARIEYLEDRLQIERKNNQRFVQLIKRSIK